MGLLAVARPAMMFSQGPVPLEEGQCPHGTNNTHLSLAAKHPPLMGGKTQRLLAGHQLGLGGDGRLAIENSTRNGRCTNVSRRPASLLCHWAVSLKGHPRQTPACGRSQGPRRTERCLGETATRPDPCRLRRAGAALNRSSPRTSNSSWRIWAEAAMGALFRTPAEARPPLSWRL